ncbi:unnamed protein product [Penicillium salamii]|uniref:Non-classical export protein 1 n=1 Tax=Penicillium salamii TaxID=1612424 RepID=A0A9W4N9A4_9EURO|nr:unnamed protein product [Penicillium salamii]CAG8201305.1 unnamed protein product [Penicillium salamii]CAG8206289.1 unnamed protein product [Penicillium salamii]CAG8329513.1 unnamed protein product [Penicillium salamii]CAG8331700.1 unnamed protein product [Penicillium salamii]
MMFHSRDTLHHLQRWTSSRLHRTMPVYLISRIADPAFALAMGVSAAFSRIQRDQREKFPERASEITYGSIVQTSGRRLQRWWNGDFQSVA